MTDDRSLERAARSWIESGPTQAPDRAVEAALLLVETTPQERDLRIPWRLPNMFSNRIAAVAAAVIVVVAGAFTFSRLTASTGPGASPSPTPIVTPAPTPGATAFDSTKLPGWIVFEHAGKAPDGSTPAGTDYPSSIWLVHADGSGLRELSPGTPANGKERFDISPDGTRVVFNSSDLPGQIWQVGIGGGNPELLSTDCSGLDHVCVEAAPSYSPDGARLAFVRASAQTDVLGVRDLTSGQVTLLEGTRSSSADIWLAEPSWSPNGDQLVYGELHFDAAQDKFVDARLFIVNADGSGRHELALPAGTPFGDADWSPDGSRIVFSSCPIHDFNDPCASVYTSRPDGSDLQVLTPTGVGFGAPSWTPDGQHILYWGPTTFYVMDPDGTNKHTINQAGLAFFGDTLGYGYYAMLQPTP